MSIFDKQQHNRQYSRLCYKYLPGIDFNTYIKIKKYNHIRHIARSGNLFIIQELDKRGYHVKVIECANTAAEFGHLHIIQYLRQNNIHCTIDGANRAAIQGHLHIIQDLYQHNIYCTQLGLMSAIEHGQTNMIYDFVKWAHDNYSMLPFIM